MPTRFCSGIADHLVEFLVVGFAANIERCVIDLQVVEMDILSTEVNRAATERGDVLEILELAQFPQMTHHLLAVHPKLFAKPSGMDVDGLVSPIADRFFDRSKHVPALGGIAGQKIDEGVHAVGKAKHGQTAGDFESLEDPCTTEDLQGRVDRFGGCRLGDLLFDFLGGQLDGILRTGGQKVVYPTEQLLRWVGVLDEEFLDVSVLGTKQQDALRQESISARSTCLLVVSFERSGHVVVDNVP